MFRLAACLAAALALALTACTIEEKPACPSLSGTYSVKHERDTGDPGTCQLKAGTFTTNNTVVRISTEGGAIALGEEGADVEQQCQGSFGGCGLAATCTIPVKTDTSSGTLVWDMSYSVDENGTLTGKTRLTATENGISCTANFNDTGKKR